LGLEIEQRVDKVRIAGRDWELVFEHLGDRWAQRLTGPRLGEWRSVEGSTEDLAPPSPAFQELLCERPAPGVVEVQLFGRAGQGVYSAAVRVDEAFGEIAFDVFVRGKHPDKPLGRGSRYERVKAWGGTTGPERPVGPPETAPGWPGWWQVQEGEATIGPGVQGIQYAVGASDPPAATQSTGDHGANGGSDGSVGTRKPGPVGGVQHRWKYCWRVGDWTEVG